MPHTHHTPAQVCVHDGHVIVDGPGAVAVTLTPAAADETAQRLTLGAVQAHGQVITGQASSS